MRNRRRFWLIIKGILIVLLIVLIFTSPTNDMSRKLFRFAMLIVFVVSFIIDLNAYKRKSD
jgi:Na+/melibiose symporter-like transporter